MDAPNLRIVESVAQNGSMNRAAAELHTVRSNVTAHIRLFEDELGTPPVNPASATRSYCFSAHSLEPESTRSSCETCSQRHRTALDARVHRL